MSNSFLIGSSKVMTCFTLLIHYNANLQVGGLEEAYLEARQLLLSMGKSTIYCGGAGNGSVSSLSCDMVVRQFALHLSSLSLAMICHNIV